MKLFFEVDFELVDGDPKKAEIRNARMIRVAEAEARDDIRARIRTYLATFPDSWMKGRDIVTGVKGTPAHIYKELSLMVKDGLLHRRTNVGYRGGGYLYLPADPSKTLGGS